MLDTKIISWATLLLLLAVTLLGSLVSGCGAQEPPIKLERFRITTTGTVEGFPDISGNIVVWEDDRNWSEGPFQDLDVYGYDLATNTEFLIYDGYDSLLQCDFPQVDPRVSGDIVIWRDGQDENLCYYNLTNKNKSRLKSVVYPAHLRIDGNTIVWYDTKWDVYGYDIESDTVFLISAHPKETGGEYYSPDVSGNTVVWHDGRGRLISYDLATEEQSIIYSSHSWPGRRLALSNNIIVWEDTRNNLVPSENPRTDIYGYDLATGTEFPIYTGGETNTWVAVDGDIVAWVSVNNGNADVYGYYLKTKDVFPIAVGDTSQSAPAVSGNTVIWCEGGDIYGAKILISP
jgi:beta propeller repeat protein